MLRPEYTPTFARDVKRVKRKHKNIEGLRRVISLVLTDDDVSRDLLHRKHRAHRLVGDWQGAVECHIDNSADLLLIWVTKQGVAVFVRVGSHDELFR